MAERTVRLALLVEHPTWSQSLIEGAHERGLDITVLDVSTLVFDPSNVGEFDLWVNRVNAMPSAGRPASVVAATGHLLLCLEQAGQCVVNGSLTHRIGGSKAAQSAIFARLGMDTPASIGIHEPGQAMAAAAQLGYPVITKPNVGGSGSGIARYDTAAELQAAVASNAIDLGIDGTGLVQRIIGSADGMLHRVEMLGTNFFYGTEQRLQANAFNYCAADGCAVEPGGAAITLFTPSPEIVDQAAAVMTASNTDVGGVEYIIDATTGRPTFYDFNPYSNFVSGFDDQLGFDPIDRYLDFILTLAVS